MLTAVVGVLGTLVGVVLGYHLDGRRQRAQARAARHDALRSALGRMIGEGDACLAHATAFAARVQLEPRRRSTVEAPERLAAETCGARSHAAWIELRLLDPGEELAPPVDRYAVAVNEAHNLAARGAVEDLRLLAEQRTVPAREQIERLLSDDAR